MARSYEQFKKDWTAVTKAVSAGAQAVKTYENTEGHTSGMIAEAAKSIGQRVQQLKDSGVSGTTLKDFAADPQVKKLLAVMENQLALLDKGMKQLAASKAGFKKLREQRLKLKDEVTAEIQARKKQTQTKLGVGNKSLPDMQKLFKEMDDYAKNNEGLMSIDATILAPGETIGDYRKQMQNQIDDALARTKDEARVDAQTATDRKAVDEGILKRNGIKVNVLSKTIVQECAKGIAAAQQGNAAAVTQARAALKAPVKEVGDIWARYERVLADQWFATKVKTSPDGAKTMTMIKAIGAMHHKAMAEVEKLAKAAGARG